MNYDVRGPVAIPLIYTRPRRRSSRPFLATLCGLFVGLCAAGLWMLTYSPHGGVELSAYLFPLATWVLGRLYPAQSIPAGMWYGGALLQWLLLGAVVDLVRAIVRRRRAAGIAA